MVTATGKRALKRLASGVPARVSAGAPAILDVPAGGTGAAAGGWDTAGNRDLAIARINAVFAVLRANGMIN